MSEQLHIERSPVGIGTYEKHTMVVCDDGSVWHLVHGKWNETDPVPGTARAAQRTIPGMASADRHEK